MNIACYAATAIAVISAVVVITQRNAMHALLYLIVMLLALAVVFFTLGAPFVAVFQIAIYAGAVMVLFVFVVMMLNLGVVAERQERGWLVARVWAAPVLLTAALIVLSIYAFVSAGAAHSTGGAVGPKEVGLSLYGGYLLAVELASLLLVAGLVGAFHIAPPTRWRSAREPEAATDSPKAEVKAGD